MKRKDYEKSEKKRKEKKRHCDKNTDVNVKEWK